MKCNPAARARERNHLRHDFVRPGNIDEHEARRDHVERSSFEARRPCIALQDLDIGQALLLDESPREGDGLLAPLNADDLPCGPNTPGQEIETSSRAAADLDDLLAPARCRSWSGTGAQDFACELLRLPLQPLLPLAWR